MLPTAQNSELYLGPHSATFKYGAKEYDQKLKPGDTQRFHFTDKDPPPFYDQEAPKEDEPTGKTNRKGECRRYSLCYRMLDSPHMALLA